MSVTNEVKEIILQLPKNQLFSSREIYEAYFIENCLESSFSKIINRMQKEDLIIMTQKGIFYLPKYKSGKRVSIRQRDIKSYIFSNKNQGVLIGEGLYFQLKLKKVAPSEFHYYTNQIAEQSKKVGNTRFTSLPFYFDPSTSSIIELMDVLSGFHMITDIDLTEFHRFLNQTVIFYETTTFENINKYLQYPKHVIAFLKVILDDFDIENNLSKYLSTRSMYKIPDWK